MNAFSASIEPNWEGLRDAVLRKGTPDRVYNIELFLDEEVQVAICERFGLLAGLDPEDKHFDLQKQVKIQSFLGYDFVRCSLDGLDWPLNQASTQDTASLERAAGREFVNLQRGPITSWEEFEAYPWPDPTKGCTERLDWYSENLPENMCIMGSGGFAHFAEFISWLPGYETCCIALCEQRDLIEAIAKRLYDYYEIFLARLLEYDRVKIIWGSDDMGFRGGLLFSPNDMRDLVLSGHKRMVEMSHDAGRPYLLHSCGKLDDIMEELIDDVQIDAKHSFEDTIEDVRDFHQQYGQRVTALGGIDIDFLCRSDEAAIRQRVRQTLEACQSKGGYILGTGNSVANYIPLDSYLAMMDEGRRFSAGG